MKKKPDRLIFTDLDGTLLDHEKYSWKPAEPALKLARKMGVPVIFCTSKTRAEIEVYRKRMRNNHPFIAENGQAVFIPKGYFTKTPQAKTSGKYRVIELGVPYSKLREAMRGMQKEGLGVRGFGDMSAGEIRKLTGLSLKEAMLAAKREYNEPFILNNREQEKRVSGFISKKGLSVVKGGRFYHLMGNSGGKGVAAGILSGIYSRDSGTTVVSAGLGDSQNDLPLLRVVSVPYLLKGHDGKHASRSGLFIKCSDKGPVGWNKAVLKFLEVSDE